MFYELLQKAKLGAELPVHKYLSRKRDGKGGWTYNYGENESLQQVFEKWRASRQAAWALRPKDTQNDMLKSPWIVAAREADKARADAERRLSTPLGRILDKLNDLNIPTVVDFAFGTTSVYLSGTGYWRARLADHGVIGLPRKGGYARSDYPPAEAWTDATFARLISSIKKDSEGKS